MNPSHQSLLAQPEITPSPQENAGFQIFRPLLTYRSLQLTRQQKELQLKKLQLSGTAIVDKVRQYQLATVIAVGVAVGCLVHRLETYLQHVPELFKGDDFNHYYATAWLLAQGLNPYVVEFQDTILRDRFLWQPLVPHATNPPPLALLTLPLANFAPGVAWVVWQTILFVTLATITWLACGGSALPLSQKESASGALFFLSAGPIFAGLVLSQVQPIIFLLVLVAWRSVRDGRDVIAGLAIGVATALKFYAWPFIALLFLLRRYRASLTAVFSAGLLALIPVALYGWEMTKTFYTNAVPIIENSGFVLAHNISLVRGFDDFTKSLGIALSLPTLQIGTAVIVLIFMLMVVTSLRSAQILPKTRIDVAFAVVAPFAFLSAPVAWENYLISCALAFGLAYTFWRGQLGMMVILFGLWVLLFQIPHPSSRFAIQTTSFYPLLRPRVIGGLLILTLLVITGARRKGILNNLSQTIQ